MSTSRFRTLDEFWPYYVRAHSKPGTRWLHFIGNTNLFIWLFVAVLRLNIWIVAWAVVSSYAFAWVGHFFVEHNIPATFRYPVKAGLCDMIMYYKMWRGVMDEEIRQYIPDRSE